MRALAGKADSDVVEKLYLTKADNTDIQGLTTSLLELQN